MPLLNSRRIELWQYLILEELIHGGTLFRRDLVIRYLISKEANHGGTLFQRDLVMRYLIPEEPSHGSTLLQKNRFMAVPNPRRTDLRRCTRYTFGQNAITNTRNKWDLPTFWVDCFNMLSFAIIDAYESPPLTPPIEVMFMAHRREFKRRWVLLLRRHFIACVEWIEKPS
jgi:hypothetical protein